MTAKQSIAWLQAAWKDDKKRINLLLVSGLAGMLLLCMSEWLPAGQSTQNAAQSSQQSQTAAEYEQQLETRLAALIRTMALKPDILLLDEPFSALDYQTRLEVCDDISSIIRTRGKTAILVTHDLSEAISVADRILILGSRPGHVTGIMKIQFNQPYDRPLARRNAPDFSVYFNQLWKEIKEHD